MLRLFPFQQMAPISYSAPNSIPLIWLLVHISSYNIYSWKTDVFTLSFLKSLSWKINFFYFPTSHCCISASVIAPDFVLGSFFHKFYLVLGSGLKLIPTQRPFCLTYTLSECVWLNTSECVHLPSMDFVANTNEHVQSCLFTVHQCSPGRR